MPVGCGRHPDDRGVEVPARCRTVKRHAAERVDGVVMAVDRRTRDGSSDGGAGHDRDERDAQQRGQMRRETTGGQNRCTQRGLQGKPGTRRAGGYQRHRRGTGRVPPRRRRTAIGRTWVGVGGGVDRYRTNMFQSVETLDLLELETRVLTRWNDDDVFGQSLRNRHGHPEWVFYEGPPTTNGRPGLHHVWARLFKDLYPRFHTMRGKHVVRKGGWDCHGLPVEVQVEKELGFSIKHEIEDYGIERFNANAGRRCNDTSRTGSR